MVNGTILLRIPMNVVIQATTISGNVIEEAKWMIDLGVTPINTHEMSLTFESKDQSLINLINNMDRRGIMLDGDTEEGFSITIKCDIANVKHMVDTSNSSCTTLVIVSPSNRTSEQVILYLMNPDLCSQSFLKSVRN
jgi:predicted amino acid racemase